VEDVEIVGVSRARVGFRAHADDVVHGVGDRDEFLVKFSLKLRPPGAVPKLLVARSRLAPHIPTTARLNRGGGHCFGGYAYGTYGECLSAHVAAFVRRALFAVRDSPVAFRALDTLIEASITLLFRKQDSA
jgi:hypothetical protein